MYVFCADVRFFTSFLIFEREKAFPIVTTKTEFPEAVC